MPSFDNDTYVSKLLTVATTLHYATQHTDHLMYVHFTMHMYMYMNKRHLYSAFSMKNQRTSSVHTYIYYPVLWLGLGLRHFQSEGKHTTIYRKVKRIKPCWQYLSLCMVLGSISDFLFFAFSCRTNQSIIFVREKPSFELWETCTLFSSKTRIFSPYLVIRFSWQQVLYSSLPQLICYSWFFFFREFCIVDLEFRCAFHIFMTHIANKHGSSYNESCSMW